MYLFLAGLGLFLLLRGLSLAVVHGLPIAVASLIAEHGPGCSGFSSCGTLAPYL